MFGYGHSHEKRLRISTWCNAYAALQGPLSPSAVHSPQVILWRGMGWGARCCCVGSDVLLCESLIQRVYCSSAQSMNCHVTVPRHIIDRPQVLSLSKGQPAHAELVALADQSLAVQQSSTHAVAGNLVKKCSPKKR